MIRHLLMITVAVFIVGLCLAASGSASEDPIARLGLSAHEGSVVYVDFWASWCVPCRESFGWMSEMFEKYERDGLVIIAVNVDRDQSAAARFLEDYPAAFRLIYDPRGDLANRFDLDGMPSSFLFGRDGVLREEYVGFRAEDAPDVEQRIQALLKEVDPR